MSGLSCGCQVCGEELERLRRERAIDRWLLDGIFKLAKADVVTKEQWNARVDELLAMETELAELKRDFDNKLLQVRLESSMHWKDKHDEWKARAEAAETKLTHFEAVGMRYAISRPAFGLTHESGPGIEAQPQTKRDDGHWVDPVDLLADDA